MTAYFHQPYVDLLCALERRQIRYVVMRDSLNSNETLKDLDILIDVNKISDFDKVAHANGFTLIKDGYLNPGKRVYLKYSNDQPYIVDLHEFIVCKGVEYLDANLMLNNRVKKKDIYYLSDEDQLLCLLFHNIFAKGKIQNKHKEQIRTLISSKLNNHYLRLHLMKFGLYESYLRVKETFEVLSTDSEATREISKHCYRRVVFRDFASLRRILQIYFRGFILKFSGKRKGLVIAFLGPDGVGKSTTIESVRRKLKTAGFSSKICYMGPWGGSLLKLRSIFSWLNPRPDRDDYKAYYAGDLEEKPGLLKGRNKWKFILRSSLYYVFLVLEMWARWYYYVLPLLRQGKIVLADRYIYDILVGYKNRPMDYQVKLRQMISNTYPKPQIGILLDSPPQIISKRKPQLTQTQLIRLRKIYGNVAKRFQFLKLDTSVNIDSTLHEFDRKVIPLILSIYCKNLA